MTGEADMFVIDREALAADGWTISDFEIPEAFQAGGDPKSFAPRVRVIDRHGGEWPAQWSRNAHWGDVVAWRAA